jgi:hypothetical protein
MRLPPVQVVAVVQQTAQRLKQVMVVTAALRAAEVGVAEQVLTPLLTAVTAVQALVVRFG